MALHITIASTIWNHLMVRAICRSIFKSETEIVLYEELSKASPLPPSYNLFIALTQGKQALDLGLTSSHVSALD